MSITSMRVPCALSLQKGELSVAITLLLTPGITCSSIYTSSYHLEWSESARYNTIESVLYQNESMSYALH
jgi:hypothetical protein